jgi:hypothetical protein
VAKCQRKDHIWPLIALKAAKSRKSFSCFTKYMEIDNLLFRGVCYMPGLVSPFTALSPSFQETAGPSRDAAEINAMLQKQEENVGLLLGNLLREVEQDQDVQIGTRVSEIDLLNGRIQDITDFIEALEKELAKPENKTIDLLSRADLVHRLHGHFPNSMLDRTSWTRAEAESLSKTMGRNTDNLGRSVHSLTLKLNQAVERRSELAPQFRKLFDMLDQMMRTIARNQRPG